MASDVTDYVSSLPEPTRGRVGEIYAAARVLVPGATEGRSYGMPCLVYKGKGLLAVMSTKHHIGVYPFGNLGDLATAVTDAGLGSTKGSIHVGEGQQLPPELLEQIMLRRAAQIDGSRR